MAQDIARWGQGFIVGISTVAGERGLQSNYIYGAAKGALSIYLSGLRNRLHKHGVRVITVLPGFVRTKLTEHLDLPKKMMAEPAEVAEDIYTAYKKGKGNIYTKWLWRWKGVALGSMTTPRPWFSLPSVDSGRCPFQPVHFVGDTIFRVAHDSAPD